MRHSASHNPFRTEQLEKLSYRFPQGDWAGCMERFLQNGRRGFIVGVKGSGKTTLLSEWHRKLEAMGMTVCAVRLCCETSNADRRQIFQSLLRTASTGTILLIDGGEQLSWWQRFHLLRSGGRKGAGGWIVTQHSLHGSRPILHHCTTSPELLAQLAHQLLTASGLPNANFMLSAVNWSEVHRRHAGNLREALLELYDAAAQPAPLFGKPIAWNAATCA